LVVAAFQLLGDKAFKQDDVLNKYAVVILAEQVTPHSASGLLIGLDRHEFHAAVGGGDFLLGQHGADIVRIGIVIREFVPDAFLRFVVVGDGERYNVLQGHLALAVGCDQFRADLGQLEPLLHPRFR